METLKKRIRLTLWLWTAVTAVGCTRIDNHGFPEKIEIPQTGGEVMLTGDTGPIHISFTDDDIIWYEPPTDPEKSFHQSGWATASLPFSGNTVTIIAEPNLTGKKDLRN